MPTYDLKLDCCGDDFAVFAGPGYHSGTALCNDTRVEGCDNLFRVKVSCLPYCPHPDWNGSGYYCVSTDPACSTSNRVCVYYGAAPTACDTLTICGGPYNTKAECEFHCNPGTGTGTAPQLSDPCPAEDPPHTGCNDPFSVPDVLYWTMTRVPAACPALNPRSGVLIKQMVDVCSDDPLYPRQLCVWLDPNRGPFVPRSNPTGFDPPPYHIAFGVDTSFAGGPLCKTACTPALVSYSGCLTDHFVGCTVGLSYDNPAVFTCVPVYHVVYITGTLDPTLGCTGCSWDGIVPDGIEITITS